MMSDARRTVERALPFGFGLVVLFEEAGVGVGARIQQSRGGLEKTLAACGVESKKLREAEVSKRVPIAGTAFGSGVCRVLGKKARYRLMVAKQGGGVDIAVRDFGMGGEDFLCAIERAVPHRRV